MKELSVTIFSKQKLRNFYLWFSNSVGHILLIIFILIGILTYSKYGMSWDEPAQRAIGYVSGGYALQKDKHLLIYVDRDYGPFFEMSLVIAEKILHLKDTRDIYLMRHLVTHLFFLTCAFFCFLTVDFLYKNKLLAAAAFLLVVLHPRLYGHSFFNTKDLPFASFFFPVFYASALAFSRRRLIHFVILGILTAILINMRVAGIVVVGLVFVMLVYDYFSQRTSERIKQNLLLSLVFFISATIALVAFWPFLWSDPIGNFLYVFNNMKFYRWDGEVLFNGYLIRASQLPWFYIPEWFIITTPFLFSLFGLVGAGLVIFSFFKKENTANNALKEQSILHLFCFIAPLAAVLILRSVVYDDWRHLYFIYSPMVLFIIHAIDRFMLTRLKFVVIGAFTISFSYLTYFILEESPYEHVYFNNLVDRGTPNYLKTQFELDYWGLSYKESLEYILKHEKDLRVNVAVLNMPGELNSYILTRKQRRKFKFVDNIKEAKYFITNDRGHPFGTIPPGFKECYSVKLFNNTINTVFVRNN